MPITGVKSKTRLRPRISVLRKIRRGPNRGQLGVEVLPGLTWNEIIAFYAAVEAARGRPH